MSWSLNFAVTGDEQVALELRGLALRAGDASPAFEALTEIFERNEERWFRSRGSRTWPPLAPSTLRRKAEQDLPSDILVGKTRRLIDSLTGHTADSVRFVGTDSFAFGSSVPWARFHRYGTVNVPERNPLVRTVFLEQQSVELLTDYFVGPILKRNRRAFGARKQFWWM